MYELLKFDAHHDVSHMTLRPISYLDRTNNDGTGGEVVRFDRSGSRTKFLDELERWKVKVGLNDENWKEWAGEFLEDVTWEPVDGQHILHACQEIAPVEVGQAGGLAKRCLPVDLCVVWRTPLCTMTPRFMCMNHVDSTHTILCVASLQRWERRCERCGNCGNIMANP